MKDERSSDTAKKIREEVGVDLFARNLLLIVFLIITGGFLAITRGMVGGVDLSFVILAIMAAGVIAYLGSMARATLRGNLVGPLAESVYYLAPATVMAVLFLFGPSTFPAILSQLAWPGVALGAMLSAQNVLRFTKGPAWLVLRAGALLVAAYFLSVLFAGTGDQELGQAVLTGGALAASISMLSLFRDHSDLRLRSVGMAFARPWGFIISSLLITAITTYLLYFRPIAVAADPTLTIMAEWVIIASAVLMVAILVWRSMRGEVVQEEPIDHALNNLRVQGERARVVEAVSAFVMGGSKEELLVVLVETLRDNGIDERDIAASLVELVRYYEPPVTLSWAWTYGDLMDVRRRKRSQVVRATLEKVVGATSGSPLGPSGKAMGG
jgi:hypothetical protein